MFMQLFVIKKKENTNEKTSSSDDIKELFKKINKLLPVKKRDTLLAIHKTLDDKKIYIHDGVYEQSYNSKGFNPLQGFTIESESGKRLIYKLNGTKTRFTNAYTTTAGELGRYLKK